jgi:hypothetical protein
MYLIPVLCCRSLSWKDHQRSTRIFNAHPDQYHACCHNMQCPSLGYPHLRRIGLLGMTVLQINMGKGNRSYKRNVEEEMLVCKTDLTRFQVPHSDASRISQTSLVLWQSTNTTFHAQSGSTFGLVQPPIWGSLWQRLRARHTPHADLMRHF